jgi:hypothetical protein
MVAVGQVLLAEQQQPLELLIQAVAVAVVELLHLLQAAVQVL